jgi:hypothetical protein
MVLEPTNPYSASKAPPLPAPPRHSAPLPQAAAEFLAMSYYHTYGLPVMITRGNNVYGPRSRPPLCPSAHRAPWQVTLNPHHSLPPCRQYPEKLIPKCITLLQRGKAVYVHGKGPCRPPRHDDTHAACNTEGTPNPTLSPRRRQAELSVRRGLCQAYIYILRERQASQDGPGQGLGHACPWQQPYSPLSPWRARAMVTILQRGAAGEIYNIGGDVEANSSRPLRWPSPQTLLAQETILAVVTKLVAMCGHEAPGRAG